MPDLPLGQPMPQSTRSEDSVEWARRQLQRCADSHASCQTPSSEPLRMPTRIIDIGSCDWDLISLVDSPRQFESYACLSYCWGDRPFLATRKDTIDSHRARIPWDLLPLTFQDAILFLRRLGIRYLWIDSLCIIQGDSDDWKRESSQMASIYQNAHLVLSATKSANAHGGLFAEPGDEYEPHVLPVPAPDGRTEHVWFRRSPTHLPGPLVFGRRQQKALLPTLSRGWIFQERLLAARVLHFGPQELLWECQAQSACQCAGPGRHQPPAAAVSRLSWGRGSTQSKSAFGIRGWPTWGGAERELGRCWHELVEEYSRLQLTHEADVFPAFSGVARCFQEVWRSASLAGLWRRSLPCDLLWHVDVHDPVEGPGPRTWGRPRAWRAPTWSWASVNSPVRIVDTSAGLEACCEVEEAVCEAAGIDPTGEVVGGFIVLRGNVIPTVLNYSDVGSGAQRPWNLYRLDIVKNLVSNVWADTDTSGQGRDHLPPRSEVYCFPVGVKTISKAVECLLLKKVDVEEETRYETYERLGQMELPWSPRAGLDEWIDPARRNHTIKIV